MTRKIAPPRRSMRSGPFPPMVDVESRAGWPTAQAVLRGPPAARTMPSSSVTSSASASMVSATRASSRSSTDSRVLTRTAGPSASASTTTGLLLTAAVASASSWARRASRALKSVSMPSRRSAATRVARPRASNVSASESTTKIATMAPNIAASVRTTSRGARRRMNECRNAGTSKRPRNDGYRQHRPSVQSTGACAHAQARAEACGDVTRWRANFSWPCGWSANRGCPVVHRAAPRIPERGAVTVRPHEWAWGSPRRGRTRRSGGTGRSRCGRPRKRASRGTSGREGAGRAGAPAGRLSGAESWLFRWPARERSRGPRNQGPRGAALATPSRRLSSSTSDARTPGSAPRAGTATARRRGRAIPGISCIWGAAPGPGAADRYPPASPASSQVAYPSVECPFGFSCNRIAGRLCHRDNRRPLG